MVEDMRFFVRFPLLYYSYVAKIHFCTEEFNFLDSPQSHPVAPHDNFLLIQRMYSDKGFDGDYDFAIKHDRRSRFNGDMSVQSQITGS